MSLNSVAFRTSQSAHLCGSAVGLFLLLSPVWGQEPVSAPDLPTSDQIVARMRAADAGRAGQLEEYTAMRVYLLVNFRFHKQARILARVTYRQPGDKTFEVISEEGSPIIRDRVLRRVIGAEAEASQESHRDQARINLVNYNIRVLGTESADGRHYFVLALDPKSKSPYLIKGKAWIDEDEYALARLEGVVAKKPSVWAGSPVVRQTYFKSGPFWLPEKNESTTEAPVFGKTDLAIESSDYTIRRSEPKATGAKKEN
jgi:hypothetical protein